MSLRSAVIVAAGLAGTSATLAGTGFRTLGDNFEAWDVSADGSVIAGNLGSEGPYAYWTEATGLVTIGGAPPFPYGGHASISDDGRYIAGTAFNSSNFGEMARYDRMTGQWTTLGSLGTEIDGSMSSGWGMSGNGQSVVGLGWVPGANAHAVRWTEGGGFMDMGSTVPNRSSRANAVNQDGNVVVGWQDGETGFRQAAVWNNGIQTLLFDTITNEALSEAQVVSDDGSVIGGIGNFATDGQAWLWSEASGTIRLGHLDPSYNGAVTGLSGDGTIAVGYDRPFGPALFGQGFIWTEATGMVNINDFATSLGIDTQGFTMSLPLGISADGTTIVGLGINLNQFSIQGWALTIPTPASAGLLGVAGLVAARRRR